MLSSLALLPLLVVASPASSGDATIDDVNTEMAGDRLIVSVTTSRPIDEQSISAKISKGRLHLYFQEARVRPDRKHFVLQDQVVHVLQRTDYAKVEVPFAEGVECRGGIATEANGSSARISVGCTRTGAAPLPVIKMEEKAQVKAAVALPEEVQPPVAVIAPAAAPAKIAPAIKPPSAPTPTPATASAPPTKSGFSLTMPMLFLAAIGVVVIVLAKRRARKSGLIEIIETAHLGPKRSLVIARVAGETMILGTSEAGITLLNGTAPSSEKIENSRMNFVPASFRSPPEEPLDEGGMLSRLFRKNQPQLQAAEDDEPKGWQDFDDLLSESAEDQELRRKLAAGMTSRTS